MLAPCLLVLVLGVSHCATVNAQEPLIPLSEQRLAGITTKSAVGPKQAVNPVTGTGGLEGAASITGQWARASQQVSLLAMAIGRLIKGDGGSYPSSTRHRSDDCVPDGQLIMINMHQAVTSCRMLA